MTTIAGKAVLVTGGNRGIGRALVEEALSRGAQRVYAGTRQPWTHPDRRVTPLILDVTSGAQVRRAAADVGSLDILVNNLSLNSLAPLPVIPAYSISKAAAFSLTQSLRALLAGRGVRVYGVMTGPTDTDMNRGFDIPKASAESVARAIFDGVERDEEEIFPDPVSESLAESWRSGALKALERQFAAVADAVPVPGGEKR